MLKNIYSLHPKMRVFEKKKNPKMRVHFVVIKEKNIREEIYKGMLIIHTS